MSFDLFPEEVATRINSMPRARAPEPGVFDNFLRGTGEVAMQGLAKAGRAVDLLGSVGPILEDKMADMVPAKYRGDAGGTVAQDRYFKEHDDVFNRAVDYWTPKPGDVGAAAQVVGSLVGTLPLVIASPALAVGSTQLGTGEDLVRGGVDASKAGAVGAVQGSGLGLGIWMPILGNNGWQRIALGGAGFNVAQGVATRAASGAILSGTAAADEYKAFDGTQITLDTLLGAAFGGIAHLSPAQRAQGAAVWSKIAEWGKGLKPSEVDALATLRVAQNLNEGSIPGKAAEPSDVNAWVQRTRTAIDQLSRDEPVNVENMPEPKIALDPERLKAAEQVKAEIEAIGKAYDTVLANPLGPADDPLVRMTPEDIGTVLLERGAVNLNKDGEVNVNAGGFGLVKIIWKHGVKSRRAAPEFQVTRDDIMRTPEVLRNFEPILDRVQDDGKRLLDFHVTRPDGKRVIYGVRGFTDGDGQQHVVTIHVNEGSKAQNRPLSKSKESPESPGETSTASRGDTGQRSYALDGAGGQGDGSVRQDARAAQADPLSSEAMRFATENPDLPIRVGTDAAGEPLTMTAKEYLAHGDEIVNQATEEAKLFEVAAACMIGAL